MIQNKNLPYYFTTAIIVILLKCFYISADNNSLVFLLKPVSVIVSIVSASHPIYDVDNGYIHESINIVIDKSCSGLNFWVLCFTMLTFLVLNYTEKHQHKIMLIPATIIFSYTLTILVNTSRIFASIVIQKQTQHIFSSQQHLLHQSTGIITNLTFLVLIYYFTQRFFTNRKLNAKPA